jgi:hypothetical protein
MLIAGRASAGPIGCADLNSRRLAFFRTTFAPILPRHCLSAASEVTAVRRASIALAGLLLVAGVGCQGTSWPRIFQPAGPAKFQRQQAQRFDPYPEGPDQIEDQTRPRDYIRPPADATQGRWPQYGGPRYSDPAAGQ